MPSTETVYVMEKEFSYPIEIPSEPELIHSKLTKGLHKEAIQISTLRGNFSVTFEDTNLGEINDKDSVILGTGEFVPLLEKILKNRADVYKNKKMEVQAVVNSYYEKNILPSVLEYFGVPLAKTVVESGNLRETYFVQDLLFVKDKEKQNEMIENGLTHLLEKYSSWAIEKDVIIHPGKGESLVINNKGLNVFEKFTPGSLGFGMKNEKIYWV